VSRFEFSTVLVSIVIAIAITEILATWGRMIRQRRVVRPYWVHIGWMALVLLLAIQFWWSMWELREWPEWPFFLYVFSLLPFLTLVVLAYLLCPDPGREGQSGYESYFFENSGWFFALAVLFMAELMTTNPVLRGEPWISVENGIRSTALLAILPLTRTKNRRVHAGALLVCVVLFVAFIAVSG
jgi:hypothetical protein